MIVRVEGERQEMSLLRSVSLTDRREKPVVSIIGRKREFRVGYFVVWRGH